MIKRIAVLILTAFLITLGSSGIALAHVLKVDGKIGAVLHINPDDNPTTGGATDYILSFNDSDGRFNLAHCDCKVTYILGSKTIATNRLAVSNNNISENHYTFTQPGVYTLRFTGTPEQSQLFQPFMLDYEIRVTNGRSGTQPFPVMLGIGMALGIGLLLLAAYTMEYTDTKGKA